MIIIFTVLAVIHFVWALGVSWGEKFAVPAKENGEKVINPGRLECIIIGSGLSLFAIFYLSYLDFATYKFPEWVYLSVGWGIPSIFMLRAIGEFKYIGFFKKVKNTDFGKADTVFFSPLCILIGIIGIMIQIV